jgi:hypothetical protein
MKVSDSAWRIPCLRRFRQLMTLSSLSTVQALWPRDPVQPSRGVAGGMTQRNLPVFAFNALNSSAPVWESFGNSLKPACQSPTCDIA